MRKEKSLVEPFATINAPKEMVLAQYAGVLALLEPLPAAFSASFLANHVQAW